MPRAVFGYYVRSVAAPVLFVRHDVNDHLPNRNACSIVNA